MADVTIDFKLTMKYSRTLSKDDFIKWSKETFRELPADATLDDIWDRIEKGDWRAEEFLMELGDGTKYWLDTTDGEIIDLREIPEESRQSDS